jgi:hypothetical protein
LSPPQFTIKYLCERFEKDLPTMTPYGASNLVNYLNTCYPELKDSHERYRQTELGQGAGTRTYEAFSNMTREKKGNEYHFPVPVSDKRFQAFFHVTENSQQKTQEAEGPMRTIEKETGFSIIRQGLNAPDILVQQAALYAFVWFPNNRPADLTEAVRRYAR